MISYIKGILVEIEQSLIVIEAANIGYNINVPSSLIEQLPNRGEEVKIYTYFQVKDDGVSLFGFMNRLDLQIFKQLIGVNGIGPKGALGILSVLRPDELRAAILTDDAKAISKAPGVGTKTAQRVILDLKDKISADELLVNLSDDTLPVVKAQSGAGEEAMEALISLGYSRTEAVKAVKKVAVKPDQLSEEILKEALKQLAFL